MPRVTSTRETVQLLQYKQGNKHLEIRITDWEGSRAELHPFLIRSQDNNWMILCIIHIIHIFQFHCLFSSQMNTNICALPATRHVQHICHKLKTEVHLSLVSVCLHTFWEACVIVKSPESQGGTDAVRDHLVPVQRQLKQKANIRLKGEL